MQSDSLCSAALVVFGALAIDLVVSYAISGGRCESNQTESTDEATTQAKEENREPLNFVTYNEIQNPKALSNEIDPNGKPKDQGHPRLERFYWGSQVVLAVFGVIGIGVALCTLRSLRTENELIGQQVENAVRPVVGFDSVSNPIYIGKSKTGESQYAIEVTVLNSAKFYASSVGLDVKIETDIQKAMNESLYISCDGAWGMGQGLGDYLGPDKSLKQTWNFAELGDFPKRSFYVFGCVAYGDRAKDCKTRDSCYFSRFCYSWAPSANRYLAGLPGCNAAQ